MNMSKYEGNAWGRRLARDYRKMPYKMRALFIVNHYLSELSVPVSFILTLAAMLYMVALVNGTWITGQDGLLSESQYWQPVALCLIAAVVTRWIVPIISNFALTTWYEGKRASFTMSR